MSYKSHAAGLSTINYFANKLAQLEQRRDCIIKKLEDRRRMFSAMKRALIED